MNLVVLFMFVVNGITYVTSGLNSVCTVVLWPPNIYTQIDHDTKSLAAEDAKH